MCAWKVTQKEKNKKPSVHAMYNHGKKGVDVVELFFVDLLFLSKPAAFRSGLV